MNTKKFFLLLLCLTFFNTMSFAQQSDKKFKVVIDAGHGGEDPGCLGKKINEKTVNLNVALKLGKLISDNYSDVQVIYTRKTDATVEVYKRAVIANNNHADLFISIHCNAAENRSAHGVETWVMGLAKSEANKEVARKENAAILKEKNFENNYEGFNPNSPEANVIFSLHTSAYMNHSILLADKVQKNLVRNTHLMDRTVKQAGFWVLYKVAMPSILVELGFLSNAAEEEYMTKGSSQDMMAASIYNAFVDYRNALDGTNKSGVELPKVPMSMDPDVAADPSAKKQTVDPEVAAEPGHQKTTSNSEYAMKETQKTTEPVLKVDNAPADNNPNEVTKSVSQESSSVHPSKKTETPKSTNPAQDANAVVPVTQTSPATVNHSIRFRVQIAASANDLAVNDPFFRYATDVRKVKKGKFWKYTSGNLTTLAEAKDLMQALSAHYKDAFVVAFDGDREISVQEALEMLK